MKSLRGFLLTRLLAASALVLAAAGLAVYVVVSRSLESQFDRQLTGRVQMFGSLLFQHEQNLAFEFSDELMPEYDAEEAPAYFDLALVDGTVVEVSESLAGARLEVPQPVSFEPTHWTAPLPDGRSGRFVAQQVEVHHVYPEEGPGRPLAAQLHIVVALGREDLLLAENRVLLMCLFGALASMGVIALLTWTAVGRGLRPTERLTAALDSLDLEHPPESLDVGPLPAELQPVSHVLNALTRRVAGALERERRTSADIAHELRSTPISELVTVSEVALRASREDSESHYALRSVRDIGWRMGRTVSTLLKLARLESEGEHAAQEPIDLGALLDRLLKAQAEQADERNLTIDNALRIGDVVEGDPDVVSIIVSNLVGNALYYATPGSRVGFSLEAVDGPSAQAGQRWRLRIANDTLEVRPSDLDALSAPFWRKDSSRSDRDRSGLGLALSRSLASRSGLLLEFGLDQGRFEARLEGAGASQHGAARGTRAARLETRSPSSS